MLTFKPEDPQMTRSKEDQYDPFLRPPSLAIARKHGVPSLPLMQLACRYAEAIPSVGEQDKCPCCGLPTQLQELSLCCSRRSFNLNGPGIALYFDFLVYCVEILVVYAAVACGFNLWQNIEGDRCGSRPNECNDDYFNRFALTNRIAYHLRLYNPAKRTWLVRY
jgi:hypothetical protein